MLCPTNEMDSCGYVLVSPTRTKTKSQKRKAEIFTVKERRNASKIAKCRLSEGHLMGSVEGDVKIDKDIQEIELSNRRRGRTRDRVKNKEILHLRFAKTSGLNKMKRDALAPVKA